MAIIFNCPLMPCLRFPGYSDTIVYQELKMVKHGDRLFVNPEWNPRHPMTAADIACFRDVDWTKNVSFCLDWRSHGHILCIVTQCGIFELQETDAIPLRPVAKTTA
jgi:hypothetical protein